MEPEDDSVNKEQYYDDEYIPEDLEDLMEACKYNSNFLELLHTAFINDLDKSEDSVDKALGYMDLAVTGHLKLPYDLLLSLTFKAVKTFPRVKLGMQYLVELCAESFYNEDDAEGIHTKRFSERHTMILKALLILSNYSSEKIENILLVKGEPSRDEQQVIDDFAEVCKALDSLFFTWDFARDKKALYEILCTRIEPRYAAVLTITLKTLIPPPVVRAFYFTNGSEDALNEIDKEEESGDVLKYYDLLAENERLKKEIEKYKKEKEEALKKTGNPPLEDFGLN